MKKLSILLFLLSCLFSQDLIAGKDVLIDESEYVYIYIGEIFGLTEGSGACRYSNLGKSEDCDRSVRNYQFEHLEILKGKSKSWTYVKNGIRGFTDKNGVDFPVVKPKVKFLFLGKDWLFPMKGKQYKVILFPEAEKYVESIKVQLKASRTNGK